MAVRRASQHSQQSLQSLATRVGAAEFLRRVLDKLPYRVHTGLADNASSSPSRIHSCRAGTALPASAANMAWSTVSPSQPIPWTNGQIGRLNRTIKEASV
ncbi:hypothetical protein [Hymenobacter guriensis]|uniref:Integrase catalytic domain-containing protein n=1 Tax=Hymenobacter guriensis TaxID=2793065 RepID=A0ABS0KZ01_9BACT|nr:hypothetical protein [Hymenobacter guriensis]MBG8553091.1 hypothetical protein [Hymenobacter guriensis]